jgi:uncharacterized membrane protein YdbT with pleckstrin-like domain
MNTEETLLWKGSPSQWTNFGAYLFHALLAAGIVAAYFLTSLRTSVGPIALVGLAVPLVLFLARWFATRSNVYELTTERIRIATGIFSRHTSELELYRVRDYSVVEPFFQRLVGRGNLVIETADRTNPHVIIRAIPRVNELKDQVRTHTERMRQVRGVRDLEINPQ